MAGRQAEDSVSEVLEGMEREVVTPSAYKQAVYRTAVGLSLSDKEIKRLMSAINEVSWTVAPESGTFEQSVDAVLYRLREVMIRKQRDYGPRNILDAGQVGVVIRANDKLARLRNLYGVTDGSYQPKPAANESIDDTWIDLANYSIIALMLRSQSFDRPLEPK